MTRYLAGVLTVIAAGVLLVAYGLLAPRAVASFDPYQNSYPTDTQPAFQQYGAQPTPSYGRPYPAMRVAAPRPSVARPVQVVEAIDVQPAPAPRVVRRPERGPGPDWRKTAMIIGGSSATGAGVGASFGGKRGALIGAAIGGGASTIYETTKR